MRRSRTRVVGYTWQSLGAPLIHEDEATVLLNRALAAGVVSQWDADTSWHCVWLNGWPGADLRAVRDQLAAWWGPSMARDDPRGGEEATGRAD